VKSYVIQITNALLNASWFKVSFKLGVDCVSDMEVICSALMDSGTEVQ
jgi:hypothetical protein